MTFEQFQATRTDCDDLGAVLSDGFWDDAEKPAKGFIYLGCLFIEKVQDHWPDASKAEGKYHLIIERSEWITDDLESLERRLYAFADSDGYFKRTE